LAHNHIQDFAEKQVKILKELKEKYLPLKKYKK